MTFPPRVQRLREEMEEITQQQLVHMTSTAGIHGFWNETPSHHPIHQLPGRAALGAVNALVGLLGYSSHQGLMGWGLPQPGKVHAGGESLLQRLDGGEI